MFSFYERIFCVSFRIFCGVRKKRMLRVGTHTHLLVEEVCLGRAHTLNGDLHVSRTHVVWERVYPSSGRGVVRHPNDIAYRQSFTPPRFLRAEEFVLRDGDQICTLFVPADATRSSDEIWTWTACSRS